MFLLNIPPNKEGLIHENDVKRLNEIGEYLRRAFKINLLETAELSTDSAMEGHGIENVRSDDYQTYYRTEDGVTSSIIDISWKEEQSISNIVIKENIICSQRIEKFSMEAEKDGIYRTLYEGTVVGYKRIVPLESLITGKIRIHISDARVAPTISFLGVY
jgi:alpha-L-fucosidase